MGYLIVKTPRDLSLIRLATIPACDRQTDWRTDGLWL